MTPKYESKLLIVCLFYPRYSNDHVKSCNYDINVHVSSCSFAENDRPMQSKQLSRLVLHEIAIFIGSQIVAKKEFRMQLLRTLNHKYWMSNISFHWINNETTSFICKSRNESIQHYSFTFRINFISFVFLFRSHKVIRFILIVLTSFKLYQIQNDSFSHKKKILLWENQESWGRTAYVFRRSSFMNEHIVSELRTNSERKLIQSCLNYLSCQSLDDWLNEQEPNKLWQKTSKNDSLTRINVWKLLKRLLYIMHKMSKKKSERDKEMWNLVESVGAIKLFIILILCVVCQRISFFSVGRTKKTKLNGQQHSNS